MLSNRRGASELDRNAFRAMAETEDRHWWFIGRRAIIRSLIRSIVKEPGRPRILEAGCGTGGNLAMLQDFGELTAFELDDSARSHAAAVSQLKIHPGSLPDGIDHIAGPFELICLFDVLEHVESDVAALRVLVSKLAPGGAILLTVPALQFLWSDHDELHHHKRRYSKSSLIESLRGAGLSVEYVSYFNTILFPLALMQRLASRIAGHDLGDSAAVPPAGVNRLLAGIFAVEAVLLRHVRMPIGLSLCAIAKRTGG